MNIHFLTYLSRSGSTLLAKKLSEYPSLGVTIEANWVDGIRKGNRTIKINNKKELNAYLKTIEKSSKYKFWNIDSEKLEESILNKQFPFCYKDVLEEILLQYFDFKSSYIFKTDSYFIYHKKLWDVFPKAKILFLDRDPRGIFNSQKKSVNSDTKKPMQSNICKFACEYYYAFEVVTKLDYEPRFLKLKYEDLLLREGELMNEILDFIGLEKRSTEISNYQDQIPNSQQHLHSNIGKNNVQLDRINGWQKELTKFEIIFLENVLKKQIERSERNINKEKISLTLQIKLFYHKIYFIILLPIIKLKYAILTK